LDFSGERFGGDEEFPGAPSQKSGELKAVQTLRGVFVERQGCRAASPDAERANQGVLECSGSIAERDNGGVDLLFILNFERIRRQEHLDIVGDLLPGTLEKTFENPHNFKDAHEADETRFLFGQTVFDNLRGAGGLRWIVLREVAQ
jgi:hypothetical protein